MDTRSPPEIIHGQGKPSFNDIQDVIDAVKINISLCSQEYRLLLFYASCGQGFRPAKSKIISDTGIDKSNIKKVRNALMRMNLIDYQCNQYYHFIFVNWVVIKGYANLPAPLKAGGKGRKKIVQCDFRQYENHPYHNIWEDYLCFLGQLSYFEVFDLLHDEPDNALRHMDALEKQKLSNLVGRTQYYS